MFLNKGICQNEMQFDPLQPKNLKPKNKQFSQRKD